jgi:hypothetical protein
VFANPKREGSAIGADPALAGNVEDDAVRIFELPLEIFFFCVVAKIEEELPTSRLDPPLRLLQVFDLEA